MSALNDILNIEKSFLARKKELVEGSPECRTYTEIQYVSQVLRLISAFTTLVREAEFKIYLNSDSKEFDFSIATLNAKQIDNTLFLKDPNLTRKELDDVVKSITELANAGMLQERAMVLLPHGCEVATAKIVLEDEYEI